MLEILPSIIEALKGQEVSAVFAFSIIISVIGGFGYFLFHILKIQINEAEKKVKDKESNAKEKLSPGEEWLKSEEGLKFLENIITTNIRLDDDRIAEKVANKIQKDLKIQIFEETKSLYERISIMREEYAGNYITKKEMENILLEIREIRLQFAKIKGKFNIE